MFDIYNFTFNNIENSLDYIHLAHSKPQLLT